MTNKLLDTETEESMQELSCDIEVLKQVFDLLYYCTESDVYCETRVELYSLMIVIQNFIKKIKNDYDLIQDKLEVSR